jgi:hypothetical protein
MTTPRHNAVMSVPPPRMRGGFRNVRGFVGFVLGLCVAGIAQAEVTKEYQIKAAFLYNFTKFVEWPSGRFANDTAPIVIGVFGDDPFGGELEKVVRDRKVNGRCISIVTLRSLSEAGAVHVLFVPAGDAKRFVAAADPAMFTGVLTVGESEPFAAAPGMVRFTTANDKVRFEINADVADRAGLKISAQLQKLATVVRRKS